MDTAEFESWDKDHYNMSSLVHEMESNTHLDAEWKRIQEKTFTRWCNEQLKYKGVVMTDLSVDLCDGVNLITLLEILSQKKLGRYNKKPRIHAQRMENVDMSLNFITKTEKIRLVNIGSGDIVGGNRKLILGLIWTLILHYQIRVGLGLDDEDPSKQEKLSAKKALLAYVQDKIPEKNVKDFTSCWNDGTVVAALVDAIAPGLCPEAETMDPKDAMANAQYAMQLAEDWLGVPMVLWPEDMVNPKVDELSMMTYVSQFPEAKLKPGAPIKLKSFPSNVKVSGPGVEGGEGELKKGHPAVFHVDTREAGQGKLNATATGPNGKTEVVTQDNKDGTFTCSYVPITEGPHNIQVHWGEVPVREEPFRVYVSPGTNALACRAYGPGVEGANIKEETQTEFFVETKGAGEGDLNVSIRGPKGRVKPVDINPDPTKEHTYHVTYTPMTTGPHVIEVTFAGLHIKDSPFKVRVNPDKPDASKCSAEGPGIESKELEVDEETWFFVHTKGAGRGDLVANTRGPHGEVTMTAHDVEPGLTQYTYTPKESGELVITVKYGGRQIPGSRFRVSVRPPPRPDKCVASGPGLAPRGVKIKTPTHFHVKTKDAGSGEVDVAITGPSGQIPCEMQSSQYSTNDYTYSVDEPGQYIVDVKFANQHIPGSPFPVAITDVSKVKITGPNVDEEELALINIPLTYKVDTTGAGPGEITCHVLESANVPKIRKLTEDNYEILYTPTEVGLYKMHVTFNEAPIPKTPVRISVYDPSKVLVEGPGLENGNKTRDLTHFNVDRRQAGEGQLHVYVEGPVDTQVLVKDLANNMICCEYTPEVEGDYVISIIFEDEHVPGSPFDIYVKQKANPSLVVAMGNGIESNGLTTDMLAEFVVDYGAAGDSEVQVAIEGPGGGVEYQEEDIADGKKKYTYHTDPDENGRYTVHVTFADQDIPGSPFLVNVNWKSDPSRVVAEGSGLEGGTSKEWAEFSVDVQKAGDGDLDVNAEGPCPVTIQSLTSDMKPVEKSGHIKDGVMIFRYFPELPGTYIIPITFNNIHIPGSPFKAVFELCTDPTKCKADGPGLRKHGVKTGDLGEFIIDTTEAGPGAVDAIVKRPHISGVSSTKPIITSNNNGTYNVTYNPLKVGVYEVIVSFADTQIPGSPFIVQVTDPSKVYLRGPGSKEEAQLPVNSPVQWVVDTTEAGSGFLTGTIQRQTSTEDVAIKSNTGTHHLQYQSSHPGLCQLALTYSGNSVPANAEFDLFDADRVAVYGPAFRGIDLGDTALFYIDCSEAGNSQIGMELNGPSNDPLELANEEDTSFKLTPSSSGLFNVKVTYGSLPVPGSPFSIPVRDISQVIVSGSGVTGEETRVGLPAVVTVDISESGPAPVEAEVTYPSGKQESLQLVKLDNNEDVLEGSYSPDEPGYYSLAVNYNKQPLPNSPFHVPISAPERVVIDPPVYAFIGHDNIIECDTQAAGPGNIELDINGPGYVKWDILSSHDGHKQDIHFPIDEPGSYEAQVLYNGFPVKESTQMIEAVDLNKCIISGPCIEQDILLARESTYIEVDTVNAGHGTLTAHVISPEEQVVPLEITERVQGIYRIDFTPTDPGQHKVSMLYNDREIDASPIIVSVADPSRVTCSGSGLKHAIIEQPTEFIVDTSKAGAGSLNVTIKGPENIEDIKHKDNQDGTHVYTYTALKPGLYDIDIQYAGVPIDESPFKMECERPPPDATKCVIWGIENPGHFTVDCRNAGGSGLLEVGVCGAYVPVEFVSVKHNGDYTFAVSYDITTPGKTTISVKWHDQHLTGSPFIVLNES